TLLQSEVQNPNDRFRADEVVLSFVSNEWAYLFSRGEWTLAFVWHLSDGPRWNCMAYDYRCNVVYSGSLDALHEHVEAILAGKVTTITARAPGRWCFPDSARL